MRQLVLSLFLLVPMNAVAEQEFTEDELSVARFWQEMGPTLRDKGIEAYAIRYHEDFTHWDVMGSGRLSDKESAVRAWTNFHEAGHRITCTYVKPHSIRIVGDKAIARLTYEQTDTYADGRAATNAFRMASVFERYKDTWQTLDSNMVRIATRPTNAEESDKKSEGDTETFDFHCPAD